MGFISNTINCYKGSEAALIVRNLLERQANLHCYDLPPRATASLYVANVWEAKPDIYSGKFDQRPHRIIIAAKSLAHELTAMAVENINRQAVFVSLGNLLIEIESNGRLYPFNSLDEYLLEEATETYIAEANVSSVPLQNEIENLMASQSWESWFSMFKDEAGKVNEALATNEDGLSLIDLMDVEPLKRAHAVQENPLMLAQAFATNFDITTFG